MKAAAFVIILFAFAWPAAAQTPAPPNPTAASALAGELDKLQSAASQANAEISGMRIEKWKTDSASKQQAQANADSLQRNLTEALPGLIASFRAAPQDVNAGFKLYRNLNALYDVFASFAESAGAFGPRSDYDELVRQLDVIDSVRHDVGDDLETLTASTQSELTQLRSQVRTMQQAAAAAPPKRIIVDDTEPVKKATHKKKSSVSTPSSSASKSAGTQSTTQAPPAKSQ